MLQGPAHLRVLIVATCDDKGGVATIDLVDDVTNDSCMKYLPFVLFVLPQPNLSSLPPR